MVFKGRIHRIFLTFSAVCSFRNGKKNKKTQMRKSKLCTNILTEAVMLNKPEADKRLPFAVTWLVGVMWSYKMVEKIIEMNVLRQVLKTSA